MTLTRCASSHLMTQLLSWRNPQGPEEGWVQRPNGQFVENRWKQLGKVISTEIGLTLLLVASAVETVSYSILAVSSLALYPFTNRPCRFFAKLLQSSSFTILWSVADALVYNPFFTNIMTRESFARYWAQKYSPASLAMMRMEDDLYIADWQQQHPQEVQNALLGPIQAHGRTTQELINQGARFLKEEVLAGASAATTQLFNEADASIYPFILTKAVYIYAAGSKKNDSIPDFFKSETKNQILAFRSRPENPENKDLPSQLETWMKDPESFEQETQEEPAKSTFRDLRTIGSTELQNGLLITGCWQKAAQLQQA